MFELALVALSWSAALETECKPRIEREIAIIGVASNPDDGRTLYCEWHTPLDVSGQKEVLYADTEGHIFARKTLDMGVDASRPSYEQIDERFGERHKVVRGEGHFIFEYTEKDGSETKSVELSFDEVDVIDAGFDQKIRSLWTSISEKKKPKIDFGSTVFQRSLPLRVREASTTECPLHTYFEKQKQDTRCFIIEPASFFVRLFFDGLKLSYDTQTRQLVQFYGPVNIKAPDAGKLSALIRYSYSPQ